MPRAITCEAALLIVVAAAAPVSAVEAAGADKTPRRIAAFGSGPDWVFINVASRAAVRARIPSGISAAELDVTPDGATAVFTTPLDDGKKNSVFLWRVGDDAMPTRLNLPVGAYENPAISPDAKTVLVVDRIASSRPHRKSFQQLVAVDVGTNEHRRVTDSDGCKLKPTFVSTSKFAFIHSNCHGLQRVVLRELSGVETAWSPSERWRVLDWNLSPDAETIAFAFSGQNTASLYEYSRTTRKLQELKTFPEHEAPERVAYGQPRELLFQQGNSVLSLRHGRTSLLVTIKESIPQGDTN